MQQRGAPKVFARGDPGRAQQSWSGDRGDRLTCEMPRGEAEAGAGPIADRGVDALLRKVDEVPRGGDAQIDLRVRRDEGAQPRRQPFGGDRGQHRERDDPVGGRDLGHRGPRVVQRRADALGQAAAGRRQRKARSATGEKRRAQHSLEVADLARHGALRDPEVRAGGPEDAGAGGGGEAHEAAQRRARARVR